MTIRGIYMYRNQWINLSINSLDFGGGFNKFFFRWIQSEKFNIHS